MNLVLIDETELEAGHRVVLADHRARHLREVLRVAVGDSVRVGVIDGPLGRGHIEAISHDTVALCCTWGEVPPLPRIDILLALPRPKVMGRLYASLAQLGIHRLMLSNGARVERYYFDAHQLDPRYWRSQFLEGLAQARDTRVPVVTVHKSFRVLIEDELPGLATHRFRLVSDPSARVSVREACQGALPHDRVLLAIGPEGGWNDFERDLLAAHGFDEVGMGPRTLRSDIATIALIALTSDALSSPN